MDKAEELKQKAKHEEDWMSIPVKEYRYVFTESDLEQYAQQVSREVATEYTKYLKPHIGMHWIKINFNKWFDEWQSNQEESK